MASAFRCVHRGLNIVSSVHFAKYRLHYPTHFLALLLSVVRIKRRKNMDKMKDE